MMVGSWDPSDPSIPWTAITGAQLKLWTRVFQAAASAPGKGNRPWITSEPPLPLSHGAEGLSGMLCPCPSLPLRGCECPSPNPSAGSLLLPVLPLLSAAIKQCIPKFLSWKSMPHKPHLSPTQDDPKGCTWGFKDEYQDAANLPDV